MSLEVPQNPDERHRADCQKVLGYWQVVRPIDLLDFSIEGRELVADLLHDALQSMRWLGMQGSWAYDTALHRQLADLHTKERLELDRAKRRELARTAQ